MQKKSKENQRTGVGAYRFGDFDLFPSERQLRRRQRPVRIAPREFDALLLFVQNAERLVRREHLIEALWPDTFVSEANLTNIIVVLRKILGRSAIQTVSKFGYRFCLPVVGEPGIEQAAYAIFLEARELATVRSLESMERARDLFAICVATDPAFAAAWAWLGRCARFLDKFGPRRSVDLQLAEASLRRALAIDPHLACAHQFYTQLQLDLGLSQDAMARLAQRIVERGDEPESYAGLVQALRFCGLLDESLAAHERAIALDPTLVTSVPHTYFLRGEYRGHHRNICTHRLLPRRGGVGGARGHLACGHTAADTPRVGAVLDDHVRADGVAARDYPPGARHRAFDDGDAGGRA